MAEAEEVSIDASASMRPVFIKTEAGSEAGDTRPISPGSLRPPSLGAWDSSVAASSQSPGLYAPPDINSEYTAHSALYSVHCTLHTRSDPCTLYTVDFTLDSSDPCVPGIVSGQFPLEEGPLTQMSEAVASLDRSGSDLAAPGGNESEL